MSGAGGDALDEALVEAAGIARRAGAIVPDETHLDAQVLTWLGRLEEAEAALEREGSERREREDRAAIALALLARIDAYAGRTERAIQRWDAAAARLEQLSSPPASRWAARARIDAAEALLERAEASDASTATARLAGARAILAKVASPPHDDQAAEADARLREHLAILLERARAATASPGEARAALERLVARIDPSAEGELAFRALTALACAHDATQAGGEAARAKERALAILDEQAMALARPLRERFWSIPARARLRRRSARPPAAPPPEEPSPRAGFTRLLEITKRLASERDLDRLLERITDSAVELSGAERGFVLLVGPDGALTPHAVHDATSPDDPHVAFSRSIAEAVLIDQEPIVTVDARTDDRLNEYLSVHRLMLQSVACLPIRGARGIEGVLYVEHRVRRGRFGPSDVELLLALADQAAIALANARMLGELEAERRSLKEANEALERANDEIARLLEARTAELDDARRELGRARDILRARFERQGIIGRSEGIRRVLATIDRIKDSSIPVVIHGESGSGKELVARAIHFGGARAKRPFVTLNCGAVPESLLESELFGHKKGAFTGADRDRAGVFVQADGGTLFLDEIGDMPAKMQVELLRVLQEGRVRPVGSDDEIAVDVRIVSASNKLLRDLVERGSFREDLFYRLHVVELRLPPLRERREDIPLLVEHVLANLATREGTPKKRVSREGLRRLAEHELPGNVRQLEHVLVNASVMTEGEVIEASDLGLLGPWSSEPSRPTDAADPERGSALDEETGTLEPTGRDAAPPATETAFRAEERRRILEALEATGWNRVRAAQRLEMPRRTFYRRLKEYGILE